MDSVRDQVLSGFIGPGGACREFSAQLAAFIGVPHCVLTTSGTVALSVAAIALGLRAGDEILVPAYGVISTINAFAVLGLKPRLVDIDRATACIDPATLERRITSATKAICFVNFSGYTGENLVRIAALAAERNVPLIEDAACAFGHCHVGRAAGSFGTVSALSFSVPKALTTGQGGAVFTDSQTLADRVRAYIDQGDLRWRETNLNHDIGTNLRFNDILAALGSAQMRSISERLARKRRVFERLQSLLGNYLYQVPDKEAPLHYIVFSREADRLVAALRAGAIGAARQYRSLYQHPAYSHLNDGIFSNADYWTDCAVYLPFGLALTEDDVERIAMMVKSSGVPLEPAPT